MTPRTSTERRVLQTLVCFISCLRPQPVTEPIREHLVRRPSGLQNGQESISDDISTSTILTPSRNLPIASSDAVKDFGWRCMRPTGEGRYTNSALSVPPVVLP